MTNSSIRIAIICGGDFPEAQVSRENANIICSALMARGYATISIVEYGRSRWLDEVLCSNVDVVVCALDGPHGEGGILQGALESNGIPFTGTGLLGCAISQDKAIFKTFCRGLGIATPEWLLVRDRQPLEMSALAQLGNRLFVKPVDQGSSFGISKITDHTQLVAAIGRAAQYSSRVLIEAAVLGTEVTVGIVERRGELVVLPPLSVSASDGFLSRPSKAENRIAVLPANAVVTPMQLSCLCETARRLYVELRCQGLCRLDAIVNQECWVLEWNTFPGVIPNHSFVAEMLRLADIGLGELLDEQIHGLLVTKLNKVRACE